MNDIHPIHKREHSNSHSIKRLKQQNLLMRSTNLSGETQTPSPYNRSYWQHTLLLTKSEIVPLEILSTIPLEKLNKIQGVFVPTKDEKNCNFKMFETVLFVERSNQGHKVLVIDIGVI